MQSLAQLIEVLEARIAPATFLVTNTNDLGPGSLRAALANADAQAGLDAIVFRLPAPPLHSENVILLTSGELTSKGNVVITGPGAGRLIIDGDNASRIFNIGDGASNTDSPVTISGLSMMHGNAVGGYGGGVYSRESLTLKNVVISGNIAQDGAGVWVGGSSAAGTSVRVSSSIITGNSASGYGGGLDLFNLKSIVISKTVVTGNTAVSGSGGGLYTGTVGTGGGIAILDSIISGNRGSYGGGLFAQTKDTAPATKITISGTRITGNTSTNVGAAGGGGLYIGSGNAVISGSVIRDNTAVYNGGGIEANGFTSLTISGSTISGNRTTNTNATGQGGGGIFIQGSGSATPVPAKITGSQINDNQSAYYAGGIFAHNGVALTISSSTVSGNTGSVGGGVYTFGTGLNKVNLTVNGGTFSNNVAKNPGGGIGAFGDGTISITGSKVNGNVVTNGGGGGIFAHSTTGVAITNVVATNNVAENGNSGGGLFIHTTNNFRVTGGSFSGNGAANAGGGIYAFNSSGRILDVTISGNAATNTGGGFANGGSTLGTVILQVTKISGNTAPTAPNFSNNITQTGVAAARPAAGHGTFVVTTIQDNMDGGTLADPRGPDGKLSLREALALADLTPGTTDTIAFALPASDFVNGAWTIKLNGTELATDGNVNIVGPGAGKLILDGNKASRVLYIGDRGTLPATISGLSVVNGNVTDAGGGIYSARSLTLRNTVISGNTSGSTGGGVSVAGTTTVATHARISNSLVTGNSSTSYGGGINLGGRFTVSNLTSITLSNAVVTGNTAGKGCGGVYAGINSTGTGASIAGCQISGNTATYGGGLYVADQNTAPTSKITISATKVTGNVSTSTTGSGGGGIYVGLGNAVITGSVIENNTAVHNGGGIGSGALSLTISSSIISGNRTTTNDTTKHGGGGIFIDGGGTASLKPVKIIGSRITDNSSAFEGGGLVATGGVALSISSSVFAGNQASFGGGMRAVGDGVDKVNLSITGSTFADNLAAFDGGGINLSGAGVNSIVSTKVLNNIAGGAGGGSLGGGIFAHSTAAANGVILKGLTVTNNFSKAGSGGGIEIYLTTDFKIIGSIIAANSTANGGGVFVEGSTGRITGSVIAGNIADVQGGGVFNSSGSVILQIASVVANSSILDPDVAGTFTFV